MFGLVFWNKSIAINWKYLFIQQYLFLKEEGESGDDDDPPLRGRRKLLKAIASPSCSWALLPIQPLILCPLSKVFRVIHSSACLYILFCVNFFKTRSAGDLWAPTYSWRHFRPQDFVLQTIKNKLAKDRKTRKSPGSLSLKKFWPGKLWVEIFFSS